MPLGTTDEDLTHHAAQQPPLPRYRCLVLDFDSTISTPTFLERLNKWAVADKPDVFSSMTEEEVVLNFGG